MHNSAIALLNEHAASYRLAARNAQQEGRLTEAETATTIATADEFSAAAELLSAPPAPPQTSEHFAEVFRRNGWLSPEEAEALRTQLAHATQQAESERAEHVALLNAAAKTEESAKE